jgi:hypothetical protein
MITTIKSVGGNKYAITLPMAPTETIAADGSYQAVHFGRTQAITPEGPNTWRVVTKKNGRTLDTATWTLSHDGNTMDIDVKVFPPDGSTSSVRFVLKRVAGHSGFAGRWETASVKIRSPELLEIEPYDSDGLSLMNPAEKDTLNMKFDGKDYAEHGPNVPPGSASSGHRVNERTLEVTDKVNAKVIDTAEYKVSPDGKTLTLTVQAKGQDKPLTLIYDRE